MRGGPRSDSRYLLRVRAGAGPGAAEAHRLGGEKSRRLYAQPLGSYAAEGRRDGETARAGAAGQTEAAAEPRRMTCLGLLRRGARMGFTSCNQGGSHGISDSVSAAEPN